MSESGPFDHVFETFPMLETARLRLRQLEAADAADVFQIYADPEVTRYYDLETFTEIQQAKDLITRQKGYFRKKVGIRWGITLKEEDKIVGTIGMFLTAENNQGGIGYDLARPYWRRGIMNEVLQCVIQFGFETAKVEQIQALVMPGNTASAGLLEKLGFQDKGIMYKYAFFKGQLQDLHNFILTRQ